MCLVGYHNRADSAKEKIDVLEKCVNKHLKTTRKRKMYRKIGIRTSKKCEIITGVGYV